MPSPAPASPAVTPRRRRGVKFWLIFASAALLSAPVLAYLGAVLYVDLGYATPRIAASLTKLFDSPVDIGTVRTNWLRDLNIASVAVQSADKTEPLKLGNVKLDFDAQQLWREKRIRFATIDRPRFDLRRNEAGKWNIGLNPEKTGGGYRIEQTILREGELALAWGSPQRALKLMALSGHFTDAGPLAPSAFSLYGVFDSLENISATGNSGPGAAWSARVFGGVNLERDLAGVLGASGPSGHVTFDLNGRRESLLLNSERGGPVTFGGQVGLERFRYPFSANWALVAPNRRLDLAGKVDIDGIPGALAALNEIQLRVEGLGLLRGSGRVLTAPGLHLSLEQVGGPLDMAALNEIFEPHLLPGSVKVQGQLSISDFSTRIPLGSGAPPSSFAAKLAARGARVAFSTLGELPACDVSGTLAWPAIRDAKLALGDLGRIAFDMKDMRPADPHFWLALADGTVIHDLHIDVGRFWESEVGRRVLTANFNLAQPVAAVADLPYIFKGQLAGSELHLSIKPSVAKPERLALSGLRLEGYSIAKWPLPVKIPAKTFSGELNMDASMAGDLVNKLTFQGKLAETGVAGPASTRVEFEHTYFPGAEPAQRVGPVKINELVLVLSDLEQIFEIKRQTGVSGSGTVQIRDASLNLQRRAADAEIALDHCELQIEVSSSVQSALVQTLKMSDHGLIAAALENYPLETIKLANLSAKLQAKIDGNRVALKGRTEQLPIRIKMPSGVPLVSLLGDGDYTAYTLPPADIALEMELDEKNAPKMYRVELAWAKQSRLTLALKPPEDVRDKAKSFWVAKGSLDIAAAGGLSLSFNIPVDPLRRQVGDVDISVKELDLAPLAPYLKSRGIESLSGRLKDVDAHFRTFSYAMPSIEKLANIELNGSLANVAFSDAHAEFERLSGRLRCVLNSGGNSVSVNALLKLDSYEALLSGGAFYIPPPAQGHGGDLHVVGTFTRNENAGQIVLNKCEMNLGDDVQFSAGGTIGLAGTAVTSVNLNPLRVMLPDMAKAAATFGPPNLSNRAPWFGDVGLSGRGTYDGALLWDARGKAELGGKIGFQRSTITLGKTTPFVLSGVSGEFPLVLRWDAAQSGLVKQDIPGPQPFELRGKMNVGPLKFGAIEARAQELAFIARPNLLQLDSPLELRTPLGDAIIASAAYKNLLTFAPGAQPEIEFALTTRIDLAARLKESGVSLNGLDNATLTGPPLKCSIRRVVRTLGERELAYWDLETAGGLRGPFFGGEISVERLAARGLFGPAPKFGGDIHLRGPEGIRFKAFTDANQQLGELISGLPGKSLGKLALRANASLTNFEAADLSVAGIQRFDLEIESRDFKDNEFWFDGELAMTLNYPLVRAAFPAIFSDDKIKGLTFGIKKLAMKFSLGEDGWLVGPQATKLPDNVILEGYGHESGLSALLERRLKQDVKAAVPPHRVPWKSIAAPFRKP